MALKLGNSQSSKKASNPSVQIPDEAAGLECHKNGWSVGKEKTEREGHFKAAVYILEMLFILRHTVYIRR